MLKMSCLKVNYYNLYLERTELKKRMAILCLMSLPLPQVIFFFRLYVICTRENFVFQESPLFQRQTARTGGNTCRKQEQGNNQS